MWSKLDDNVLHHDKTETAARRLGRRRGLVIALGTVTFGLVYCNWKLTDGFIHRTCSTATASIPSCAPLMVDVGFWHVEADGYRIHDFHEFNPSAAAVKARRLKDRLRKQSRDGFHVDSTRNPDGFPPECPAESRRIPRGSHGFHNASQSRADPVPSRPSPTLPLPLRPRRGDARPAPSSRPRSAAKARRRRAGVTAVGTRRRARTSEACRLKTHRGDP